MMLAYPINIEPNGDGEAICVRFPDFRELTCGASARDEATASALSALKEEIERRIRSDADIPRPGSIGEGEVALPLPAHSAVKLRLWWLIRALSEAWVGCIWGGVWFWGLTTVLHGLFGETNAISIFFNYAGLLLLAGLMPVSLMARVVRTQWVVSRTLTDRIARLIWTCALSGMILYVDAVFIHWDKPHLFPAFIAWLRGIFSSLALGIPIVVMVMAVRGNDWLKSSRLIDRIVGALDICLLLSIIFWLDAVFIQWETPSLLPQFIAWLRSITFWPMVRGIIWIVLLNVVPFLRKMPSRISHT